jgi:hypothetical protein
MPAAREALLARCADVRVLHLHGGGYVSTDKPASGFLLGAVAALAGRFGLRLVASGWGVEPFGAPPDARAAADLARALDAFALVECRDAPSHERLSTWLGARAVLGLDDCYLAPARRRAGMDTAVRRLHVSLTHANLAGMGPRFVRRIEALRGRVDRVTLWQCFPHRDREVIDWLLNHLPDEPQVLTIEDLLHEGPPVLPGDLMLTCRFHPHFMAARLGARGWYHAQGAYYAIKHASVVERGSPFLPLGQPLQPQEGSQPAPRGSRGPAADAPTPSELMKLEPMYLHLKSQVVDALYEGVR